MKLRKIISGGQTGVDQAALRAAQAGGLECGGWCPPGRVCEGGTIPLNFPLEETPEESSRDALHVLHSQRTEWNVRDSEATLVLSPIISNERLILEDPGTHYAIGCALRYERPILQCDPFAHDSIDIVKEWLEQASVSVLNVAGPSESTSPGIGDQTYELLMQILSGAG